jgi:cytochrome c oxidase cbb3-type subunit 4
MTVASFISIFQSIWTIVVMVIFLGIIVWAWSSKNQKSFDKAANIPFEQDDLDISTTDTTKEKKANG